MAIGSGVNFSQSAAMYLRLPIPGQCGPLGVEPPGTSWLELLNASLSTLDQHTHAPGYGIPVPAAGINLNADVPFNSNNATALRSVRFSPIGLASLGASDLSCLAVSGGDLYFVDAQANQVRLTASGGVAGTPGSISGLAAPASASYTAASKLFTFTSASGFAAALSAGPLSIGDASVANGKAVTLSAPAGLAGNYGLTLPAGLPSSTKILTVSATGAIGAGYDVDNSTLQVAANILSVKTITGAQIAAGTITTAQVAAPVPTAITPNANWTAANGFAYWKDAAGTVHLKGQVSPGTGALSTIFTLPAGFRPGAQRLYLIPRGTGASDGILVQTTGNVDLATGGGSSMSFDGVSFLAEA